MRVALVIFLSNISLSLFAQDSTLYRVAEATFYDKTVRDTIFVNDEYFGRSAFVKIDSILVSHYPNLPHEVWTMKSIEAFNADRHFNTRFMSSTDGNVYVGGRLDNFTIPLYVAIDKYEIDDLKQTARLVFHTTAARWTPEMAMRYLVIDCHLKMRRDRWVVKDVKFKRIQCCDNPKKRFVFKE